MNKFVLSPLSKRLQSIFDLLVPGEPVWDLCCDHGKLGKKALASGLFGPVYFVDSAPHLIEKLKIRVRSEAASFYALPAEEIPEPWTGNVVAAGVGAYTIHRILQARRDNPGARRLILGPHRDEEKLKQWLLDDPQFSQRYELKCQVLVSERGRGRHLLVYDRQG